MWQSCFHSLSTYAFIAKGQKLVWTLPPVLGSWNSPNTPVSSPRCWSPGAEQQAKPLPSYALPVGVGRALASLPLLAGQGS